MSPNTPLGRRRYLQGIGATGLALAAGCTGLGSDSNLDHVVLDQPDQYELLREARDNGDLDHPIHGDELPAASAHCIHRDLEVATSEFESDRHSLYTFIFTRCHGACPGLTAGLRHVQSDSVENGYADDVALVNVTFDPTYDTPAVLEEYGAQLGVEYDVGNWYDLRPESEAAARRFVEEAFGCFFERNPDYDEDEHHDHDDDHHGHDDEHHGDDDEHEDEGMAMAWQHESMIVLANADGYVERTYVGSVPSPDRLIDDVGTLLERW